MNKTLKNSLIGAFVIIGGYQIYKRFSKPKQPPKPESKSNFSAYGGGKKTDLKDGLMKYETNEGKVYKWRVTPTKSQWIRLNETQQPKAFDWYNLNGKWIWTKWNGKLDV